MNAGDLKLNLASQAQAVCEYLLPNGKVTRGEYEVGSVDGETGKSLKIRLGGTKAGVWSDFATGNGGDLLDLWQQVRGLTFVETLDQVREYLGVEKPEFYHPAKREWHRPAKPVCTAPQNLVKDYLVEDRNIPGGILEKYKVAEQGNDIVFPFLDPSGQLVMAKRREAVDGAKPVPTEANCEKILFGWQAVDDNAREIYITEGEIDALSLAAYGYPALSVPFGGGGGNKQDWIESEFDRLERFEAVYLCLDNDEPGEQAAAEIAQRLGRHRCRVVTLPRKDANECLVDGLSAEEIQAAIDASRTMDPDTLSRVSDYIGNVVELFYPAGDRPVGYSVPYLSMADKIIFRPAEVTVWTGATGSGKSQILSDCTVSWISKGARVVLASLEMAPAQSLKRMVKQVSGIGGDNRPTQQHIEQCLKWLDPGLVIYNRVGKDTVITMLEAFIYARSKWGSDTFIIDSLMRCGIPQDDYNAQEAAVFQIVNFAIEYNVHVHLVAHARKRGAQDKGPPDTEQVKGAMEITANAFNVIGIYRDRETEDALQSADGNIDRLTDEQRTKVEAGLVHINISKQRNGDFVGKRRLHFLDCYQYRCNADPAVRVYREITEVA